MLNILEKYKGFQIREHIELICPRYAIGTICAHAPEASDETYKSLSDRVFRILLGGIPMPVIINTTDTDRNVTLGYMEPCAEDKNMVFALRYRKDLTPLSFLKRLERFSERPLPVFRRLFPASYYFDFESKALLFLPDRIINAFEKAIDELWEESGLSRHYI